MKFPYAVWRCLDKESFEREYLSGFDVAKWKMDYFDQKTFPPNVMKEVFTQIKRHK